VSGARDATPVGKPREPWRALRSFTCRNRMIAVPLLPIGPVSFHDPGAGLREVPGTYCRSVP